MKTKTPTLSALVTLVAVLAAPAASATGTDAYTAMIDHYEMIRTALVHDTTDGVAENARGLESTARALAAEFDAAAAGVPAEAADDARALLPEIAEKADDLAVAEDLAAAREALGELTKPLVRYRKLTGDTDVKVAYCPMVKKSWLQKDDETVGNPYYGQEMADCGEFVGN